MNEALWILPSVDEAASGLAAELGIPLPIALILANRKIVDPAAAHQFLYGLLTDLHDPFLMNGMMRAKERILQAANSGEKIIIFGDYDVDGILSVVALSKALRSIGADVDYYIPDRLSQGYGLKEDYVNIVLEKKSSLVISVDCGIKAVSFVEKAKKNGIDVIITDHHQPGSSLPDACAILNPVLDTSGYPDKGLAGIGVVFKLIQTLLAEEGKSSIAPHYLKLVSIGTVADVAPLRGENRLMVKYGLNFLENVSNVGLKNLLANCGLTGKKISVGDVGFRIGPRINAAGRLGLTDLAVRLFFSESDEESQTIVKKLDRLNAERQKIEERILDNCLVLIKAKALDKKYRLLMLGCEEWHRGVIGIVASRLKDLHNRPVILFSYKDGKAFGSGRSIREFSLIDCLEDSRGLLLNYGGHRVAVGCELRMEDLALFKSTASAFAQERISEQDLKRKLHLDAKIRFRDIDAGFVDWLALLSPFGVGNPKPLFLTEGAVVVRPPQKLGERHSKFYFKDDGLIFEALAWQKGEWADIIKAGDSVDLVYSLQFSQFSGEERLSLSLEDIKPH